MNKKIFFIFLIFIIIMGVFTTYAEGADILDNLNDFKPDSVGEESTIKNKANIILGTINVIGAVISVVTIILIGFGYMMGSIEEKANYKQKIIPWIIGMVILFSATTIPNIIYKIGTSINVGETESGAAKNNRPYNPSHPEQQVY